MICSTGLFKTGWEKTEEDRSVRLIMAGREHDKEEGGFPNQNRALALCLLSSFHLGSCFGVSIEGDRQRTISVLVFISPTCPFHLYL